ncbi:MAG: TerC family protein [Acetobacteraceae bacterium]|nr:TerC family protein [Acetobacteraceae bacterium]
MLHLIDDPQAWISLLTLTTMEIVLGIDNLVFVAILAGRLPSARQASARRLGLFLALFTRLALLTAITWIMRLTQPLFGVAGFAFSWRDLILIGGGLFLVWKGTAEIHHRMEGEAADPAVEGPHAGLAATVAQIVALDLIFSLDSVITAVGMANDLSIMMAAVVIAVGLMLIASGPLSKFIGQHPTVKMLALSFLLLIGMTLVADGFGAHVPKGYVYAAMGFSALVESLNLVAARRTRHPT